MGTRWLVAEERAAWLRLVAAVELLRGRWTRRGAERRPARCHVDTVRTHVLDPLSRAQLKQLSTIADALLTRLDPTA